MTGTSEHVCGLGCGGHSWRCDPSRGECVCRPPAEPPTVPVPIPLPMPNERIDGGIVIASVWLNDDPQPDGPVTATLMLLLPQPPFYRVVEVEWHDQWRVTVRHTRENINTATECYAENGGD